MENTIKKTETMKQSTRGRKRKIDEEPVEKTEMPKSDAPLMSATEIRIYTARNVTIGYYDLSTIKVSGVYRKILVDLTEDHHLDELKRKGLEADRDASLVRKVFEWMEHYKDHTFEPPKATTSLVQYNTAAAGAALNEGKISEWDQKFLDVDKSTLYGIADVAYYLDIGPLKNAVCKTIANMFKGKTSEEMTKEFGFKCNIRKADLKRMAKEKAWFVGKLGKKATD